MKCLIAALGSMGYLTTDTAYPQPPGHAADQ